MNVHIHFAGRDNAEPTYRLSVRDGETVVATAPDSDYSGMFLAEDALDQELAEHGLSLDRIPLAGVRCHECKQSGIRFY